MGERELTGPWRPPPCPLSIVPLGALSCSANMITTALPQTHTHTQSLCIRLGPHSLPHPGLEGSGKAHWGTAGRDMEERVSSPPSYSLVTMVTMGNCWRLPATCWAVRMPRARQGPMVQACGPRAAAFVSSRRGGGRCSSQSPRPLQAKGPGSGPGGQQGRDTSPVP